MALMLKYIPMKVILLFFLLMASTLTFSQADTSAIHLVAYDKMDSLRIAILEQKIDELQLNLGKAHSQYREGLHIAVGSFVGGILLAALGEVSGVEPMAYLIAGGVGVTTGSIMMIDSHKWIGRAGKFKRKKQK